MHFVKDIGNQIQINVYICSILFVCLNTKMLIQQRKPKLADLIAKIWQFFVVFVVGYCLEQIFSVNNRHNDLFDLLIKHKC